MPIHFNPDSSFSSREFTMKSGRKYTLVATTTVQVSKYKSKYIHTVKNDQGEYQDFEHSELIRMVEENP